MLRKPARFITQTLSFLRGGRADLTTDEGRADDRMRKIALTAAASALAKLVSIATSLITVPLTLHYLGTERYGLWVIISSFTLMLTFADLGIGNGLLTAVAVARGKDDFDQIRSYVSSAFVVLGLVGCVIITLALATYAHINWSDIFNVQDTLAVNEVRPAMLVFFLCFGLSLPATIIQRLQLGLQLGFMSSLWQCAGSVAALIGTLVVISLEAGLPWLVLMFNGLPIMVLIINSLVFFTRTMPESAPQIHAATKRHAAEIGKIGFVFFILQVTTAVAYTSDSVLIANKLGAAAVAEYAVPDRLFALISLVVGFVVMPLWPAFGEAFARGDHVWAKRTLVKGTWLALGVSTALAIVMVVGGRAIIEAWVGSTVQPSVALLIGLGAWRILEATASASSMYLNGLRIVWFQVAIATMTAAVALSAKLLMVEKFGVYIVPWATFISYAMFAGLPMLLFLKARIK
jgi:O-antigen/teichoic acid export membrane protein